MVGVRFRTVVFSCYGGNGARMGSANTKLAVFLTLLLTSIAGRNLGCCLCFGDDGSARRYVELLWHDDLFLDLFLESCLLERKDVQRELKMTAEQTAKVKHIFNAKGQEIPGYTDLVASYRKRQSDRTLSASDTKKLAKAMISAVTRCTDAYQRKELAATLSVSQRHRLGELLIQMRGPIAIVDDSPLSSKLQLNEKQRLDMKETVKDYEGELKWLQARYGREQFDPVLKNETQEDRQKEVEALFVIIRAIKRERDAALLETLTPEQLALWRKIQGKPFPITWRTLVWHLPFEETKQHN